jgi:hypothetical protein
MWPYLAPGARGRQAPYSQVSHWQTNGLKSIARSNLIFEGAFKLALFEVLATWKGCGTFSEEYSL